MAKEKGPHKKNTSKEKNYLKNKFSGENPPEENVKKESGGEILFETMSVMNAKFEEALEKLKSQAKKSLDKIEQEGDLQKKDELQKELKLIQDEIQQIRKETEEAIIAQIKKDKDSLPEKTRKYIDELFTEPETEDSSSEKKDTTKPKSAEELSANRGKERNAQQSEKEQNIQPEIITNEEDNNTIETIDTNTTETSGNSEKEFEDEVDPKNSDLNIGDTVEWENGGEGDPVKISGDSRIPLENNKEEGKEEVKPKEQPVKITAEYINEQIAKKEQQEGVVMTDLEKRAFAQELFLTAKEKEAEEAWVVKKYKNKALNWWNKDKELMTRGEKIARNTLSAGLVGMSIFGVTTGIGMSTGNSVPTRALIAGMASGILTSRITQESLQKIKGQWNKLSKSKKIALALTAGGVGVTAAIYFAGISTIAITGLAIAGKVASNQHFDKKINEKKDKIEELEKAKDSFNIEDLIEALPEIQGEIEKLSKSINNKKTTKSIISGGFSLAAGTLSAFYHVLETDQDLKGSIDSGAKEIKEDAKNWWDKMKFKIGSWTRSSGQLENEPVDDPVKENKFDWFKSEEEPKQNETGGEYVKIKDTDASLSPEQDPTENTAETYTNENAIIDGKKIAGITYAFKEQLEADPELAKALGVDTGKLDNAKYMAKITKELAIKTGYMDESGHEIRITKDGMGKVAYELKVGDDGKAVVNEINVADGKIIETNKEGSTFEGENREAAYEEYTGKKYTYGTEDASTTTTNTEGTESPDTDPVVAPTETEGEPAKDEEPAPNENNLETLESYNFDTVTQSPEWQKAEDMKLRSFFGIGKANMNAEQIKIAEYLRSEYATALAKDGDLENFILKREEITVAGAREIYNDVINKGYDIPVEGNTAPVEETVSQNETKPGTGPSPEEFTQSAPMREIFEIAKEHDYSFNSAELKNIYQTYDKNIVDLVGNRTDVWNTFKDLSANQYMKLDDADSLSRYLNHLKDVTGLKPENGFLGLGKKEDIDAYIMRATLEAVKMGKLESISTSGYADLYQEYKSTTEETLTPRESSKSDDLYYKERQR